MTKFLLITFLFVTAWIKAQKPDSAWIASIYAKEEVTISMRDGVKLFTTIYTPKDVSVKHPLLLVRTPYSVAPYGPARFSARLYATHWINYIKAGYIIVMQDVRGTYMSEGEFVDVRPFIADKKSKTKTDEASDAFDTIDWLVKNLKSSNGNVGVFGISYPGFYATMAALSNHPALKAVSPQAPVTDWFIGDDFHHNGAFALMDGFSFYSGFGKPRPKPTTQGRKGFEFPIKDNYQFHLGMGALKNYAKHMDSAKFWKDLMDHPDYDEFWKARDARRACVNVKPAMLEVGGTFDAEDCFGAWNLYKAIEKQSPQTSNRLVMGPWVHGGWHRGEGSYLGNVRFGSKSALYFQEKLEPAFFDYYLLGKGDITTLAEATIFFSGENAWRQLPTWPPANIENRPIYLSNKGKLSFQNAGSTNTFSKYTSDPQKPVPYADGVHLNRTREYMDDDQRFAARRPDVMVYETAALENDLTLAGTITANLIVSISSTDADFVVKVIDVFPPDFKYDSTYCCKGVKNEVEMGGYQMLVRGEIMRGRYRTGFDKPTAFTPDKMETVKFDLPDVAHTFKKGHKLMVQVQSSWFPLFDRNPQKFVDIYNCSDDDFVPCDIKIYHDAVHASYLTLPVLKN